MDNSNQCDATVLGRNGKPRQCYCKKTAGSRYCKRHTRTGQTYRNGDEHKYIRKA